MIQPNPASVLIYCRDRECGHRIGLFLLTQLVHGIDIVTNEDDALKRTRNKHYTVVLLHDPDAISIAIDLVRASKDKQLKSVIRILPTRDGELLEPKWRTVVCEAINPRRKHKKAKLPKNHFSWRHQP